MGNVLQWALKGAEMYARLDGELQDCDAVQEATKEYFSDVDTIAAWLEAEHHTLTRYPTMTPALTKLRSSTTSAWCEAEGPAVPSSRTAWGTLHG